MKSQFDSTIARMAGNIAGNMLDRVLVVHTPDGARYPTDTLALIAQDSVALARAIVAEVVRTQPPPPSETQNYEQELSKAIERNADLLAKVCR